MSKELRRCPYFKLSSGCPDRRRLITIRLANALQNAGIQTLTDLKEAALAGTLKAVKNLGNVGLREARELVGLPNSPSRTPLRFRKKTLVKCEFCGEGHACKESLKSVPAKEKVRIEFFQNIIVSDVTDETRAIVEEFIRDEAMIPASSGVSKIDRKEVVIYCNTPEEAERLRMRLKIRLSERLDP